MRSSTTSRPHRPLASASSRDHRVRRVRRALGVLAIAQLLTAPLSARFHEPQEPLDLLARSLRERPGDGAQTAAPVERDQPLPADRERVHLELGQGGLLLAAVRAEPLRQEEERLEAATEYELARKTRVEHIGHLDVNNIAALFADD